MTMEYYTAHMPLYLLVQSYREVGFTLRQSARYVMDDRMQGNRFRGNGNRARRRMRLLGMLVFKKQNRKLIEL